MKGLNEMDSNTLIGHYCRLYKTCKICNEIKWYKYFESKGKGKRKTYCKHCKSRHNLGENSSSQYIFDTQSLKKSDIEVRLKLPSKKRIRYTIPYEQAILLVKEGMAGIVHETLIHKFYDKQTFKKKILQKYNYTCCYCGKVGDTIDHIKPKSNGGISSFSNCICACKRCNKNKDNLSIEEFLFYIEPIEVSAYIQDGCIEEQLKYLAHSLDYLNTQILNKRFLEEQSLDRIYQTIEQVEKRIVKIKNNTLELRNSKHSVT